MTLKDRNSNITHHVGISIDPQSRATVTQHTSNGPTDPSPPTAEHHLRVLSFNLWHTSPPSYLYPDHTTRWRRYAKRLRHLVAVVLESQASVIG
jgi:hypothetical protein